MGLKPKERVVEVFNDQVFTIPASEIELGYVVIELEPHIREIKEAWRWNGFKWVGQKHICTFNKSNVKADTPIILDVKNDYNIWLDSLTINYQTDRRNNDRNFWEFILYRVDRSGNQVEIARQDTKNTEINKFVVDLSQEDNVTFNNTIHYMIYLDRTRQGGTLSLSGDLTYRQCRNHEYDASLATGGESE